MGLVVIEKLQLSHDATSTIRSGSVVQLRYVSRLREAPAGVVVRIRVGRGPDDVEIRHYVDVLTYKGAYVSVSPFAISWIVLDSASRLTL